MNLNSRRSNVVARNGMVATTQPLAAMAGVRMMMQGGNAVDAAVATAAALNVVEPHSTGVGGDAFALVWLADEKRVLALNASGRAPQAASRDELLAKGMPAIPPTSAYSVTTPGGVAGWEAALERCGTMTLAEVLEPAIEYAERGYPVSEIISGHWAANAPKLLQHPSGAELLNHGRAPAPGEVMRLPELAGTLRIIAEGGADAFYNGPLAERIAGHVQKMGGWLTSDDMAANRPEWVEPVSVDYRGVTCWECPPNSQGVNALMALNLVEGFDLAGMGYQSADAYHHMIESMRLAFADGLHYVSDPSVVDVPVDRMLSKGYAEERRRLISAERAMALAPAGAVAVHSDTVYLAAADGQGNACSFINSVFQGFGSGIVVPGTGIALHNRGASFSLDADHANSLEPGKRPFHTLIPGMATRDGELWLTYGVMGAMQQAQGHLQTVVNMVDFGLDPQIALDAPRFSVRLGQGIAIESTAPVDAIRGLAARGHRLMVERPHGLLYGSGQVIERDPDTGVLRGGSEPRADGFAIGW